MMSRYLSRAVIPVMALCLAASAMPQVAGGTQQSTPETLKATYDHALIAKDWAGAIAAAQKLVDLRASADNLRLLGDAQVYSNAPQDALATYDRALASAQQEKPPQGQADTSWKELVGKIKLGEGNAFIKLHRNSDAIAALNQAAEIAPNPSLAHWNLCATLYNIGDVAGAVSACRKATEADPARADAWFLLGSLLYVDAKLDANGKFVISEECRQALDKYLELAPGGPHAADVKQMLAMIGK